MLTRKTALFLVLTSFFSLGMTSTPKPPPGDTTPPQVSITAPLNNATLSGSVNIQATASDNVGVTKVEFYVDNALKSTDTTSPYAYSWDTTAATNASHALKAAAYDAKNNSNQAQINVTVNNTTPPPPTDGSELIITAASASSSNGSYPAARAKDKNLSTYWQGNWSALSKPKFWWLTLDLGKSCFLAKLSIFWNKDRGSTNYNVQGSANGSTWANLYAGLSSAGSVTNPAQKDHNLSGSYRYIRIYINTVQNTYPIIYEAKLYGQIILDVPAIDKVTTPTKQNFQVISGKKSADAAEIIVASATASPEAAKITSATSWMCTINSLKEGENIILVRAKSGSAESAPASVAIVLDTQGPALEITSPKEGEVIR